MTGLITINLQKLILHINLWRIKSYSSIVGSFMYAQVYTRTDITFGVIVPGRYQSNPNLEHRLAAKKVVQYLQTNIFILTYCGSISLEVVCYVVRILENLRMIWNLLQFILVTCETDYNYFIYNAYRVQNMSWGYFSNYLVKKFHFWVKSNRFHITVYKNIWW